MFFTYIEEDQIKVSDDLSIKPELTRVFETKQEALDDALMRQRTRKDSERKAKRIEQLIALGAIERHYYMNLKTGAVADYDEWFYENEQGVTVNAVDLGEVVEVTRDSSDNWIEVK